MTVTPGSVRPPRDWLDRLWRFISSGRVTAALIALLALALALSAVFPQVPIGVDNVESERWLSETTASYREFGPFLRTVGAFTILQSFWLRLLWALLAYNLALRLADQLRWLAYAWRRPGAPPPLRPGLATAHLAVTTTAERALATVEELLRARYPCFVKAQDADRAALYGRRGRPAAAVGPLLTAGLLLLLVGQGINLTVGWRTAGRPMTAHSSAVLPLTGGVQLSLASFGRDSAAAPVSLTWPDGRQEQREIGAYRPARVGNLWIVQLDAGPALAARASSGEQPFRLQSLSGEGQAGDEIQTPFPQAQTERAFAIPARNLTFRIVSYDSLPAQGVTAPVFLVEAYRGDDPTPVLTRLVETQATFTVDDVAVVLRRERYVTLAAAYLPGLGLMGLGGLLLLAAAILGLAWRYAETWVHLTLDRPTVAIAVRTSAGRQGRDELQHLSEAIAAVHSDSDGESGAGPAGTPAPGTSPSAG